LRIHLVYRLRNVGTTDLTFLDAKFPDEKEFGRKDLRAEIDGRDVSPAELPAESEEDRRNMLRLPFDPPWTRGQTRMLSIEYTFASPANSGSLITLGQNEFHLASRSWFAELQAPKHLLAATPTSPPLATYAIRVPADFVVLARGTPKGHKRDGGQVEHRFVLLKDDLPPFVVAGRYVAAPATGSPDSALFWTLEPLKDNPSAAEQITADWNTLQTDFGPLDKNIVAPHIVESPELLRHLSAEPSAAAVAFPGGAIVNPAALALGTTNDEFLELVAHALSHNWFGDQIRPTADSSIGLGEGLPEYATIVIEEARNGEAGRRRRILDYERRYNDARAHASETPLDIALLTDPIGPRRIALAKAPLFYVTLEDVCGEAQVRKGLARLVTLLRGQTVDYNVLRAVLEESTGRNLAQMFRVWLNDTGLPQDFLERYPLGLANQETGD
jgi:Peptidase family M1 domain